MCIACGPNDLRSSAASVRSGFQAAKEVEQQASQEMIREHGLEAFCRALFNTSEFLFLF